MAAANGNDPRVAWVESPLQLINAIEYAAATDDAIRILPRAGVAQLDASIAAISSQAPQNVTFAPPTGSLAEFSRARRRLIGDVFSGRFRLVVATTGVRDLVIVDDGSATIHAATLLATRGATIARMAQTEGAAQRALGRALGRTLRRSATRAGIPVFTAYDAEPAVAALSALGFRLIHNDYRWVAGLELPGALAIEGTVVLGTALGTDRQVDEDRYADWVAELAAEGPVAYLPHRREGEGAIGRIAALPGVTVHRTGLPVEFVLGASSGVSRVVTLPSSAVVTLRSIVAGTIPVESVPVPADWWLPSADPAIRAAFDLLERNGDHD